MFVMNVDAEFLSDRATDVELDRLGITNQVWGHVNLEALLAYHSVRAEVFAFEMHVDRHVIFGSASTNGWNEVDRGDTATFLDQRCCIGGYEQFHA